jgi:hypothetical protein
VTKPFKTFKNLFEAVLGKTRDRPDLNLIFFSARFLLQDLGSKESRFI